MEFLVSLSRPRQLFATNDELQARRLELLRKMLLEIREITDHMIAAMPAA